MYCSQPQSLVVFLVLGSLAFGLKSFHLFDLNTLQKRLNCPSSLSIAGSVYLIFNV